MKIIAKHSKFCTLFISIISLGYSYAGTVTLQYAGDVVDDARITSISPGFNGGGDPWGNVTYFTSNSNTGRTYIHIPIPFFITPQHSDSITNANLKLYFSGLQSPNFDISVHEITGNWSEFSITWSNRPNHYLTAIDTITLVEENVWVDFNITKLVKEWVSGEKTNYGVVIKPLVEGPPIQNLSVLSSSDESNSSLRPILEMSSPQLPDTFINFLTENLILNPGCEDALVAGEIPYWTEVIGSNWTQRFASPEPYEGQSYFFPGVATLAELHQDVDVSNYKSAIDVGTQSFIFEGFVRAYTQSPPDQSRIILEFLDSLKTTKIDSFDSGNYSNTSEWVQITDTSLAPFGTRYIRIRLVSTRKAGSNNDGYYDGLSLVNANLTGIKEVRHNLPESPILFQNYPNPFNPTTTIEFSLPKSDFITLTVYNILGEKVVTLVSEKLSTGSYKYKWEAGELASGMYLYRLEAGDFVEVKKMILVR